MTDIQLLIAVIVFFGLAFMVLFWYYNIKKKIIIDRLDALEQRKEPTFSDLILIAYWNEIRNIDVNSEFLIPFAEFLRRKLSVIKSLSELIYINFNMTTKKDFKTVFGVNRMLLKTKLQETILPDSLKNTLSSISQKQIEGLMYQLVEVSEFKINDELKNHRIKTLLIGFVTDNFRQSVLHYNLIVANENEFNSNASNSKFEECIKNGELMEAAVILSKTGKQAKQTLQFLSKVSHYELEIIEGTQSKQDLDIMRANLIAGLIKLNDLIKKTN